jgi:hypothetical protein
MSLPITIPNTFATETNNIPLSELDDNFTTVADAINDIGDGTNALANVAITGGTIDNVTANTLSISDVTITGGSISGVTAIAVASGGTGLSNITANTVLIGNGTSAIQGVAPGTSGNVLTSNGTAWASAPATITSGTVASPTSGTTVDFTGIPSWVKRVTVIFSGLSTNGTSNLLVQIGSGSFTTTGYLGSSSNIAGVAAASTAFTNGFAIRNTTGAASLFNGCITINLLSGNTYAAFGVLGQSDTACNTMTGGSVTISGACDRVRLTTANGTDTFDAGSINILYE